MSFPSSQQVGLWVIDSLEDDQWHTLRDICIRSVAERLRETLLSEIEERIEEYLPHIAEDLRNRASALREDGELETFEIDNEPSPYIRGRDLSFRSTLSLLRQVTPSDFERTCVLILNALGSHSEKTGMTRDGGVDFLGYNFAPLARQQLPTPIVSQAIVIGQAKRSGKLEMLAKRT